MAGHSLGNNVTEVYTHVTDQDMQKYAIRLGELLGKRKNEIVGQLLEIK